MKVPATFFDFVYTFPKVKTHPRWLTIHISVSCHWALTGGRPKIEWTYTLHSIWSETCRGTPNLDTSVLGLLQLIPEGPSSHHRSWEEGLPNEWVHQKEWKVSPKPTPTSPKALQCTATILKRESPKWHFPTYSRERYVEEALNVQHCGT